MTYEQYWEQPPILVKYYRQAHELKIEEQNQKMWVQGLYIKSAIVSTFDKNTKYPDKPFELKTKENPKQEPNVDKQREEAVEWLNDWAKQWGKKFNGRSEKHN